MLRPPFPRGLAFVSMNTPDGSHRLVFLHNIVVAVADGVVDQDGQFALARIVELESHVEIRIGARVTAASAPRHLGGGDISSTLIVGPLVIWLPSTPCPWHDVVRITNFVLKTLRQYCCGSQTLIRLTILFLALGCLLSGPGRADTPGHWPVYLALESGSSGVCIDTANLWVGEGAGKFSLYVSKSFAAWTLPMAADGSIAAAETLDQSTPSFRRHIRVTVPAGSGPRAFEILDMTFACRYRLKPM